MPTAWCARPVGGGRHLADFPLPTFGETSLSGWLKRHQPLPEAGSRGTVAIFATCLADYNFPHIGASAVRVLEQNGWNVVRPDQTCCGMPNLDGGDVDAAKAKAHTTSSACSARSSRAARSSACSRPAGT